jgi:hypothetical protein
MAPEDQLEVPGGLELLVPELPDRLQHREPRRAPGRLGSPDQRLVHQGGQPVEGVQSRSLRVAYRFGRFERPAAGEHRQPREQASLHRIEQGNSTPTNEGHLPDTPQPRANSCTDQYRDKHVHLVTMYRMAGTVASYSQPNSSEDSSAPRRGVEAVLGSCSAAAARAAAQVSSPRSRHGGQAPPDAATRARSGRPASGRRSRGYPDTGHAGRRLSASSVRRADVRPIGHADVRPVSTRPVSTRPVPSRCPDGRASGVRGSAAALSAPRWPLEWLGAASRPGWAQWVRRAAVIRGRRGRLPASGLKGRDGAALAVGGSHEGRRQTWAAASHAHRRRLAASPPGRQGSWSSARVPVGWLRAREHPGAHQSPQVRPGQAAGVVPDHGLDRKVVTTLRGRWLVIVLCRQFRRAPSGWAGEQIAAAARPRHVRSAVRLALTGS